jgi:hypothetical protein
MVHALLWMQYGNGNYFTFISYDKIFSNLLKMYFHSDKKEIPNDGNL